MEIHTWGSVNIALSSLGLIESCLKIDEHHVQGDFAAWLVLS